MLFSKTSMRFV